MLWAFIPVVVSLAIRIPFFPDTNFNSWPLLLVLAPATEEALKLFLVVVASLVGHLYLSQRTSTHAGNTPEAGHQAALFVLVLPVEAGLFYGLWEHVSTYPAEPLLNTVARALAHMGYTLTALAACLFVWRRGYHAASGLWAGTLAGMLPHAIFNLGPLTPAGWPVTHTILYSLPVAAASFVIGLLLLRWEERFEPGSASGRLLATGEADLEPQAPPG